MRGDVLQEDKQSHVRVQSMASADSIEDSFGLALDGDTDDDEEEEFTDDEDYEAEAPSAPVVPSTTTNLDEPDTALPYTLPIPDTQEEFTKLLFKQCGTLEERETILSRMISCNHVKLSQHHTKDMEVNKTFSFGDLFILCISLTVYYRGYFCL